ncbi:IclR family transcriptional regulator [Actinomadura macra]|uniref:IclR family transcriptional regulator n=1 Tax=Actinomadura macra TaxID=46164 RepID=UPI0009FD57E9|nr:IclR family transcriptional regulator [Actinomadura macra]
MGALGNAIRVLDLYAQGEPAAIGVREISRRLDMSKSTVQRIVSELAAAGYLSQDEETERYSLGTRIFELGTRVFASGNFEWRAWDNLLSLREEINETVHLAVRSGRSLVYVAKSEPHRSVRAGTHVGARRDLYPRALGKVLLAAAPPEELEAFLAEPPPRLTPNTVTDPDAIRAELKQVAHQGWATDDEECEEGVRCVAVPLRNREGKVVAAVSVTGPADRLDLADAELLAGRVLEHVSPLTSILGPRIH